jgi:hypothetical protein
MFDDSSLDHYLALFGGRVASLARRLAGGEQNPTQGTAAVYDWKAKEVVQV